MSETFWIADEREAEDAALILQWASNRELNMFVRVVEIVVAGVGKDRSEKGRLWKLMHIAYRAAAAGFQGKEGLVRWTELHEPAHQNDIKRVMSNGSIGGEDPECRELELMLVAYRAGQPAAKLAAVQERRTAGTQVH